MCCIPCYCLAIQAVLPFLYLPNRKEGKQAATPMKEKTDVWQGTRALMVLKTLEAMEAAARLGHCAAHRTDQQQAGD